MRGLPQKQNARRADKIRLCGHLGRYKKIVKKTYIIYWELLKLESIQAFEERKARAKRLGEEAGTKLLLPMFLMLAVVLIIVIVPAFLTMQI